MNAAVRFHVHLHGPGGGPLPVSFADAMAGLETIGKVHVEPDGSLGWTEVDRDLQIVGTLYDVGGRVRYVDLQGSCRQEDWRQLLTAILGGKSGQADLAELEINTLDGSVRKDLQSFEKSAFGG